MKSRELIDVGGLGADGSGKGLNLLGGGGTLIIGAALAALAVGEVETEEGGTEGD